MSTDLIAEIRGARAELRRVEAETAEAASRLRLCKDVESKAKKALDELLDELETGQSRYPLPGFDRLELPAARGPAPGDVEQAPAPTSTVSIAGGNGKPRRKSRTAK